MIIGFILITFFLAISIALINGKLSFLVAGYNSMDELEKTKYDEKKVCRKTGIELLLVDIVLIIVTFLLYTDYGKEHSATIGLIAAVVIVTLIFGNVLLTQKINKASFKTKKIKWYS